METLIQNLSNLKDFGCCGIKISYEDEGALLNEIITMRYLTSSIGLKLSIKIGGCEAKRDISDCIDIGCDSIVAPMIESKFALNKFLNSLKQYEYDREKGFNLETINAYNCFNELKNENYNVDFVTFGRVDFVSSLCKDRNYVNSNEILEMVTNIFRVIKENLNVKCYLGGAISIETKDFIKELIKLNLLDKFETRYVIFDVNKINIEKFDELLYLANLFEVEWLKYISLRYNKLANKDIQRILMIEDRINKNKN